MLDLLRAFTHQTRLIRLATPLGADALLVECLRGVEGIDRCYSFDVTVLSADPAIALSSLLGQPALIELESTQGGAPRVFHGHITAAENQGADGGLARYALTIGPWLEFLRHRRDSRVFQNQSVPDILSSLFSGWRGRGTLVADWRFDLQDPSAYPARSLTCQYQETDLQFAQRLMSEEGLFYYFEHAGAADGSIAGRHTMVIADHNASFTPNVQPVIRFTQPGAVMREDSMDRWRTETRLTPSAVELTSWDYRSRDLRAVSATATGPVATDLVTRETPGAYAYPSREHGQRIVDRQMEALELTREIHVGAGTVRTLAPGTTFTLTGQAKFDAMAEDERRFVALRVIHMAHNNVTTGLQQAVFGALGRSLLAQALDGKLRSGLHAVGSGKGERPLYRNRIDAISARVPYRSARFDGQGQPLHPKPNMRGQQTAIVVGPPGAVVHTDRDHRIKVQFHWQRGEQSHSRLEHPVPEGHTGAPADDRAGTWVRVVTQLAPVAGANWGAVAVPRVGSEVLVDFIDGDIDRPVVIGAVYNGAGQVDAQHNQVAQGAGAAVGSAPAWFPGEGGAHAHAATLSGLKSQQMRASGEGGGGYSQLVFDDTAGESRVALQRHAQAHAGTDELNLGHLRHQADNQRLQPAGFGAELKSEHGTALRAGQGMLLSTDPRHGAAGQQMDSREAQAQIEQAVQLQQDLAKTAQQHNAKLRADEGDVAQLPAIADLNDVRETVDRQQDSAVSGRDGSGSVVAYGTPHLQLSAQSGIVATTPASALLAAGTTSSIGAASDIDLAAQGHSLTSVKSGISMFTYGTADGKNKANQETGIRLHAASGKVCVQSQSDVARVTADKAVTVASVGKSVNLAAKEHLMLTAQGAYLKLEGGNIMIHGPGTMSFKASAKELAGPEKSAPTLPHLPAAPAMADAPDAQIYSTRVDASALFDDIAAAPGTPYIVQRADGSVFEGKLDQFGRTGRVYSDAPEDVTILIGDGDWEIIEEIDYD